MNTNAYESHEGLRLVGSLALQVILRRVLRTGGDRRLQCFAPIIPEPAVPAGAAV